MSFATLPVQVERSGLEEVSKGKDEMLPAKESEISEKDQGVISLQRSCDSLQTHKRNQLLEVSGISC